MSVSEVTVRPDVAAWLGDTAVTADQAERLADLFDAVDARWPDPDDADTRREVLIGAAQVVLDDAAIELQEAAAAWHQARQVERDRMANLTGALMASTGSEQSLADRAGCARMTVRKALGR